MSSNRHRFTDRPSLALPALGAALALVVASCSASTDSAVSGTVVSSSGSASASASATSTQALFPTPSASPSASASDPCAELSWIDAIPGSSPSSCCTAAMVHHILLFHRGKFIGTATYEPYSFSPVITRTSDSSISVTYRYMKEDEKVHNASGRTTAEFSWSSSQNKVVLTGEVPPSY